MGFGNITRFMELNNKMENKIMKKSLFIGILMLLVFTLQFMSADKNIYVPSNYNENPIYNISEVNGTSANFEQNVSASWFKGLFNWTIGVVDKYITSSFTGSSLDISINETELNNTIKDLSLNESEGDSLYAGIEWGYNQTIISNTYTDTQITNINNTGNIQNLLNSTGIYSTFNSTYDAKVTDNESWNQSFANTLYIVQGNESNLNVNNSDFWDSLDTPNSTQMENSDNQLNIKESWLTTFGNNLWCALTGCTMQGEIDMNNGNITNILKTVYNITGCTDSDFGTFCYDTTYDTMRFVTASGQILQMNQEATMPSKNEEGTDVVDGSIVYITSSHGTNPDFKLARADNLSTAGLLGVVTQDCNNNQVCPVVFFGIVHNLDTSDFTTDDHLYLSETEGGNFTTTPPEFPNVPIWVATAIRIHPTEGTIFVSPRLDSSNGITMNTLGLVGDFIQTDYKIMSLSGNEFIGQNVFAIEMNGTTGVYLPHEIIQPGGAGQASVSVRSRMFVPESVLCLNSTNRTNPQCFADEAGFSWDILDFNTSLSDGADVAITGELEVIKDANIQGNVTSSWFNGLFNWTVIGDFFNFNGATLIPNSTTINQSIRDNSLNQTEADNIYLNLPGDNADQNMDISPFNFTAGSYFGDGQFLTGIQHGSLILFTHNEASDVSGSLVLDTAGNDTSTQTLSVGITVDEQEFQNWTSPINVPGLPLLSDGVYELHLHARFTSPSKDTRLQFKFYRTNSSGGDTTFLFSSVESNLLTTSFVELDIQKFENEFSIDPTDRLLLQLIVRLSGGGGNPTVEVQIEGDTSSRIEIPSPSPTRELFIPYTGAIKNVDLGSFNVTSSFGKFSNITSNDWTNVSITESQIIDRGINFQSDFNDNLTDVESTLNVNDSEFLDGFDSSHFAPENTSFDSTEWKWDGGWADGGLSIIGGDIYAQNGYFYNISGLNVTILNTNGSILPSIDNTFDLGSAEKRWEDLFLSGEVRSNGTGDNWFLGNVGIGTTSPVTPLEVLGTINVAGNFNAVGRLVEDNTDNQGIYLGYDSSGQIGILAPATAAAASELAIWTFSGVSWGERMRIDGGGNVGIGTINPSHPLNVNGAVSIIGQNTVHGTSALVLSQENASKSQIRVYGPDAATVGSLEIALSANDGVPTIQAMFIDSDGNVGVGTNNPDGKLHIFNASAGTITPHILGRNLVIEDSVNTGMSILFPELGRGTIVFGSDSDNLEAYIQVDGNSNFMEIATQMGSGGELRFGSGNAARAMTILSGGDVGMGTASPTSILHLKDASPLITMENTGNTIVGYLAVTGEEVQWASNRNPVTGVFFDTDKTDVRIRMDVGNAASSINFFTGSVNGAAGSQKMIIDKDGNVGIGTTSLGTKLEIDSTDAQTQVRIDNTAADGDPVLSFALSGTTQYIMGIDDGDGDKFKITGAGVAFPLGNLFTLDSSGNVGIGTESPSARLDVEVSSGGAATLGANTNTATGNYAVAMGFNTNASGLYSVVMGRGTIASEISSTAMGFETTASGESSTAMGRGTIASGDYSTAMGFETTASGRASTVMGQAITAGSNSNIVAIGLDSTPRTCNQSNSMCIMGGDVGIGTTSPTTKLDVNGSIVSGSLTITTANDGDSIDVSGVNVLFTDTTGGDITITGFIGGVNGQRLYIANTIIDNDVILQHDGSAAQDIFINLGADETLNNEYGGWILINNGTNWYESAHAV